MINLDKKTPLLDIKITETPEPTSTLTRTSLVVITILAGQVMAAVGAAGIFGLPFAIVGATQNMNIALIIGGIALDVLPLLFIVFSQVKEIYRLYNSLKDREIELKKKELELSKKQIKLTIEKEENEEKTKEIKKLNNQVKQAKIKENNLINIQHLQQTMLEFLNRDLESAKTKLIDRWENKEVKDIQQCYDLKGRVRIQFRHQPLDLDINGQLSLTENKKLRFQGFIMINEQKPLKVDTFFNFKGLPIKLSPIQLDPLFNAIINKNTLMIESPYHQTRSQEAIEEEEKEEALKKARESTAKADTTADLEDADKINLSDSFTKDEWARDTLGLTEDECYLHQYFESDMSSKLFAKAEDTDQVSSNGIVKSSELTDKEAKELNKKKFKQILAETYSNRLANLVWDRYQFDKVDGLTVGLIKQALVGIAGSVRQNDLETLFLGIKHKREENPTKPMKVMRSYNYLKKLNSHMVKSISEAKSFDELSPEQIQFLMLAFRTLPAKENEQTNPEHILNVLYPNKDLDTALTQNSTAYVFLHDVELLKILSRCDKLDLKGRKDVGSDEEQHQIATSEYVGKTLAYRDLTKGMVVSIPDINNKQHFYVVEESSNKDGLIPALLVPLNKKQNPYQSKLPAVHLIYRGTASNVQWRRNIDHTGVGRSEYEKQSAHILNMIENYLKKSDTKDIDLHIDGHSLGGCDSQRGAVSILEAIVNSFKKENNIYKKIKRIVITTHNAPRPEPDLNLRLKKAIAALHLMTEDNPISIELTHIQYFDENEEDVVQKCGYILLGADRDSQIVEVNGKKMINLFRDTPFLKRKMIAIRLKGKYGTVDGILPRHTSRPFDPLLNPSLKWEVKQKYDDKDESSLKLMEHILADSYYYNSDKKGLYSTLKWFVRSPPSMAFSVMQRLVNYTVYVPLSL